MIRRILTRSSIVSYRALSWNPLGAGSDKKDGPSCLLRNKPSTSVVNEVPFSILLSLTDRSLLGAPVLTGVTFWGHWKEQSTSVATSDFLRFVGLPISGWRSSDLRFRLQLMLVDDVTESSSCSETSAWKLSEFSLRVQLEMLNGDVIAKSSSSSSPSVLPATVLKTSSSSSKLSVSTSGMLSTMDVFAVLGRESSKLLLWISTEVVGLIFLNTLAALFCSISTSPSKCPFPTSSFLPISIFSTIDSSSLPIFFSTTVSSSLVLTSSIVSLSWVSPRVASSEPSFILSTIELIL